MRRVLLTLLVAALLVGCGDERLSTTELQDDVAAKLARDDPSTGKLAVLCDGGMLARVGARQDCRVQHDGQEVGLRVRAVATDPLRLTAVPFLAPDTLAAEIARILKAEGRKVESVRCPDELVGRPQAHVSCTARIKGHDHDIDAKVTGVDGLLIDFTFEEV